MFGGLAIADLEQASTNDSIAERPWVRVGTDPRGISGNTTGYPNR